MDDETLERANAALEVTLGNAWYKHVAFAVAIGATVAVATYSASKRGFDDCFKNVRVVPLEE